MKVLLDTCVWGGAVKDLRSGGHDVIWAGEWNEDPGDEEILTRAYREGRVLITLDKDFGELAVVRKAPHPSIIRLVDFPARQQGLLCLQMFARYERELLKGSIITVELGRVRIRPADREE